MERCTAVVVKDGAGWVGVFHTARPCNCKAILKACAAEGKATVDEIRVQDGRDGGKYAGTDKVPEAYRDKVKTLVELIEKGQSRLEVKP